eukprot:11669420-Alexandrium_andersonii.AAC.1
MWRDAYAQAHGDALANNTTYRAELWKLTWSMQDIRRAKVHEKITLFAWDAALSLIHISEPTRLALI